eukprot:CAMPEP_0172480834 /NCGR_PEP_ID=MMETSP1066-20121228/6305_1 /TAXON_ID=671091 /ORGANISM="Coscinodiscus wailesii, Strain CCMP2513" /LENGTH=698 /DNA_ID=CAMNT_0013242551 /DNA_START=98 /DNA_END=2194 /DNA_ORIENTATION=+
MSSFTAIATTLAFLCWNDLASVATSNVISTPHSNDVAALWQRVESVSNDTELEVFVGHKIKLDHDNMHEVFSREGAPSILNWSDARQRATGHLDSCKKKLQSKLQEVEIDSNVFDEKFEEYMTLSGKASALLSLFEDGTVLGFGRYTFNNTDIEKVRLEKNDTHRTTPITNLFVSDLAECMGYVGEFVEATPPQGRGRGRRGTAIDDGALPRRGRGRGRGGDDGVTKRMRRVQSTRKGQCTNIEALQDMSNEIEMSRVTPGTIAEMYSVSYPKENSKKDDIRTSVAVFEFQSSMSQTGQSEEAHVSIDDLDCFWELFELPSDSFFLDSIDGTANSATSNCDGGVGSSCAEPNLDVQYLSTAISESKMVYVVANGYDSLLQQVLMLSSKDDAPVVVSISYGSTLENDGYWSDHSYEQLCNEFGSASLTGTTFFAAAGDDGASNSRCPDECKGYRPQFPASCPYVTAVGATYGFSAGEETVAMSGIGNQGKSITTGGGFSDVFSSHVYNLTFQQGAVDAWLQSDEAKLSDPSFDKKGRAYPDISAVGVTYQVILGGKIEFFSGTSAATPVIASMTARAVELTNRTKGFGWINPKLYQAKEGTFFDVVEGSNEYLGGCEQESSCQSEGKIYGYKATKGWDPASGVGTLATKNGFKNYVDLLANSQVYVPPTGDIPSTAVSFRESHLVGFLAIIAGVIVLSL